jgi:hypothetical protein
METRENAMTDRYSVRPDALGFTVYDVWTGEPLVIAMTAQTEMSHEDAVHTAELFNSRARKGERKVLQ